jgi:hypothetical protein
MSIQQLDNIMKHTPSPNIPPGPGRGPENTFNHLVQESKELARPFVMLEK